MASLDRYPEWGPHSRSTDPRARVCRYRDVNGVRAVRITGGSFRSAPVSGVFELYEPERADPIEIQPKGKRLVKVICAWRGGKPNKRGIGASINLSDPVSSAVVIDHYSGEVVDNIGYPDDPAPLLGDSPARPATSPPSEPYTEFRRTSPSNSRRARSNVADAKTRLCAVIARLAEEKRPELQKHKENYADMARPDFLWHYLLQSFATMGRSAGWQGLIGNKANYDRVTYDAIEALPSSKRLQVACETCRAAKVRMPDQKGDFILGCYTRIRALGGPEAAKAELLSQPGREAKILWLKTLPGIGDKYARNIMMDVYHEEFRDSIAVDARIKSVSDFLGISFASYSAHEQFYLNVAHQAGLNGWELDRLLYNFLDEVLSRL